MNIKIVSSILTTLILLSTSTVFASKVDLHIWIGQQVINDLEDDGQLSFSINSKVKLIKINKEVCRAILGNKQYFLMGNIGPDALPEIYSGQMIIHPGSEKGGWGTGDWLAHLLKNAKNDQEVSFVYGYMCHAASDVFAHTYVNQYAGDWFNLTDGETRVEERHFLIEGYISQFMPPMLNYQGNDLGTAANNVKIGDQLAIPADFLWRVFIQDKKAIDQFSQSGSVHFTAIHNLYNELGSLSKDGGVLDKIHIQGQKLAAYYYLDLKLSNEDLEKINKLRQKVLDYGNYAVDGAQAVERVVKEGVLKISKLKNDHINKRLEELGKLLAKWAELLNEKHKAENDVLEAKRKMDGIDDQICKDVVVNRICESICVGHLPLGGCIKEIPGPCRDILGKVCDINPKYAVLKASLNAKQDVENAINSNISRTAGDFKNITTDILATSEKLIKAEIELSQLAVDFLQRFATNENGLKGIVLQWQKDIKIATEEYFKANGMAIHNSIAGQDIMEPLLKWQSCWMPAILGIPSEVSNGVCITKDVLGEIKDLLNKIESFAAKQDPILNEIVKYKKEVEEKLKLAAKKELYSIGEKATGVDVQQVVTILSEKATKETVNNAFAKSDSKKALLVISDAAQRIESDMQIDNGNFSQIKFNMVFNSIVLSKMAILDFNGLNTLTGSKLYSGQDISSINIMVRLARSIDGNHHWLSQSPPFIRADGNLREAPKSGYKEGFVIWENKITRNKVFRKLFKGPMNPSLETPEKYGFTKVIPESYPYKPTEKCPFPNYPVNSQCN